MPNCLVRATSSLSGFSSIYIDAVIFKLRNTFVSLSKQPATHFPDTFVLKLLDEIWLALRLRFKSLLFVLNLLL